MTIRVGVIGTSFARKAMLPALALIEDVKVAAIVSRQLARAQAIAAEFSIPHAYDEWRQMLESVPLDLVCIVTPVSYHAPMAIAALEAGAHVLCEKPMAMNKEEAQRMLHAAQEHDRVHMIDHELRFEPNRRKIKELIETGYIGSVRHVDIVNITTEWAEPKSRPVGDWWSRADMGGGRLANNGSHQIDLLRYWLGEVKAASGQLRTVVEQREIPDTGAKWMATADDLTAFTLEMECGALASVFISDVARHDIGNHTRIVGSEGTIQLSNNDDRLLVARPGGEFEDVSVPDPDADIPGLHPGVWTLSVVKVFRELMAAIRGQQPITVGATFDDGLKCQIVLDGIRESAAHRHWVSF